MSTTYGTPNPELSSSASSSYISGQESPQQTVSEKDRPRPQSPTSTFNNLNPNVGIGGDARAGKGGAGAMPRSRFADAMDLASLQKAGAARRANNSNSAAGTPFDYLANTYVKCAVCGAVPKDAVQVNLNEPSLACRGCARSRVGSVGKITELPVCLLGLMREVVAQSSIDLNSVNTKEDLYADENAAPMKRKVPVRRQGSRVPEGSVASPLARDFEEDVFFSLEEKERKARMTIFSDESALRAQIMERMQNQSPRNKRSSGPDSRAVKMEADKKYEHADYTGALELYTKAIKLQKVDGACQLKFLLGNRSAAHFMAMRYKECMEDCLEITKMDPDNSKMLCRAALSALSLGDLKQAVSILEGSDVSRRTEQVSARLAEYKNGLDLYAKAERAFGTPQGDEFYRMLVAQFTNITPFRIRFAESLIQEKQYMRAVETLEAVAHASRSPQLCRIMAYGLYMSGFEHFERSRKILRDVAQLDEDCRKLLQLIDQVDDAKQKGNTNFAQKNFKVAVENYAVAINLASDNEQILRILYCNRAAAHKELGNYRDGVEDCTKAIKIEPDFFKAYARRARCHLQLGDNFAAVKDFKKALSCEPNDHDLVRELRQAENALAKEAEKEKDYYFQLGVSRGAADRDIKLKYRELSLRWHPDKCVGMEPIEKERAEHKFKIISEAYATLMDPQKRREYDWKMDRERLNKPAGFNFTGFGTTAGGDHFRGNRFRAKPGDHW